ncbi:hypothetical protein SAMN05216377_11281 [Pseudonocardia oroxyli]|uniref:Uncharacterized protein n=1 Tax=Pseudonocardia oroxyli TaxID=366584 RepID=A0A1G7ULB8_PSEOR|nr:hypothetical protein SAMN05216377_11281 [Pseudonocardia oroxyli]
MRPTPPPPVRRQTRNRVTFERVGGWPLVIAGAPLAIAAIRLLVISRLDLNLFAAWISGVNLLNVWIFGLIFFTQPFSVAIPMVLGTLLVLKARSGPFEGRFWRTPRYAIATIGIVALMFCLTYITGPDDLLSSMLAPLVVLAFMSYAESAPGNEFDFKRPFRIARRFAIAMAGIFGVLSLIMQPFVIPPGVPHERVRITGSISVEDGWVLAVDDVSLTFAYRDGGIRRIPTGDIEARHICPNDADNRVFPGLADMLYDSRSRSGWPAACFDLPAVTRYP